MSRKTTQTPKPATKPPGKRGPDPIQFSRAQKDDARRLIGSRQYVTEVVKELVKLHKVSEDLAYRLVNEARQEVLEEMAGRGVDPAAALFLFFESFMADPLLQPSERMAAAANMMKLFGLKRLADKLGGEDVDAYLARLAQATPTPPKGGESNAGADPQTGREDPHRG
jgi:hypothetical protein